MGIGKKRTNFGEQCFHYFKGKHKNNCTWMFYSCELILIDIKIAEPLYVFVRIEQIRKYTMGRWEPGTYLLEKRSYK